MSNNATNHTSFIKMSLEYNEKIKFHNCWFFFFILMVFLLKINQISLILVLLFFVIFKKKFWKELKREQWNFFFSNLYM